MEAGREKLLGRLFWPTLWTSQALILLISGTLVASEKAPAEVDRESDADHSILCRRCGRSSADPSYLLSSQLSPFDALQKNLTTLFGKKDVPLQSLQNPHGAKFDCVLFKRAGCVGIDKWSTEATWFPGYAWRVCLCPQCGEHLGWMFEPVDTVASSLEKPSDLGFYALILDKLIDEAYASSLLAGTKLI